MNFKMSARDFNMLAKFVEKKAKDADLRFVLDTDKKLEVKITLQDGDDATISFFCEEVSSFPKITRSRNLGDEL